MSDPLILVTGATGAVGSKVVEHLLQERRHVRVLTRDAERAAKFGKGADVAIGELGLPDTLVAAFAGVSKAFVLSSNNGGPNAAWEANAFRAAKRAGVDHIVKLSGRGVDSHNARGFIGQQQAASERDLRELGVGWTILRPSFFASNFLRDFPVAALGTLHLPAGDGKDSPIDPRDIAAVAVKALTTPGHEGNIYELTGADLLSYAEMVREISAAVGGPLSYADVPAAAFRRNLTSAGAPEPIADALVTYFTAVKDGRITTTSTVAEVTGVPPRRFSAWVRDNASLLKAQSSSAAR